jgi:hypothetical protein
MCFEMVAECVAKFPGAISSQDGAGRTAVHCAAANKDVTRRTIVSMIEYDPNVLAIQDQRGRTPIITLIDNKHLLHRPEDFLQMLQFFTHRHPATVEIRNTIILPSDPAPLSHQTALMALCERRTLTPDMLRAVVQARPTLVNLVDAYGAKPLLAISRRNDLGGDLKTALRDIILPHVLEGKA